MRGLIVAYSFPPNKGVGALRPAYWAKHFHEFGIEVEVISAFEQIETTSFKHHFVPLKSKSVLSKVIKDEGIRWRKDVEAYLNENKLNDFDFVLISGGPFFHFSLARYFKEAGMKVFLDFRDPFSYNPRMNEKGIKKWLKRKFEKNCVKQADAIISVNKECHAYINPENTDIPRWVIPNGYNDEYAQGINIKEGQGMFYAGKFYWPPINFLSVLEEKGISLQHAGAKLSLDHPYLSNESYEYLGYLGQNELYNAIEKAEIGVVFTMAVPFESTTKIYDYIALNKKILVITKGRPNEGALKRELDKYPYHQWVRDEPNEIKQAIEKLNEMEIKEFDTSQFSRKHALAELAAKIKKSLGE